MERFLLIIPPLLFFSLVISFSSAAIFTLKNNCPYTIWPVTLSTSNSSSSIAGISELPSNSTTASLPAPPEWSGRVWARTGCLLSTSQTTCTTGESPPFTIAEFNLKQPTDSYDVTLVQGYNVGIGVSASGDGCKYAGCMVDLNMKCPAELRVVGPDGETTVACKTPCEALGGDEYCCTGTHSTPETCKKTRYSELFKTACPDAYTYLYDDESNTFSCGDGADYLVTFCPSTSSP